VKKADISTTVQTPLTLMKQEP